MLKWSQVEKRLRELIKDNRYLNPKEKDHYADYLESVSAPQYEVDTQRKIARQRFIDAHRDLPPADKRDTLLCGYLTLSVTWTGTKKACYPLWDETILLILPLSKWNSNCPTPQLFNSS